MIQIIYDDGTKERFTNEVIDRGKKISYQKELTEEELHKIPEVVSKKLVMRDKTPEELAADQKIIDDIDELNALNEIVNNKIRDDAKEALISSGEITQEQADKLL